MFTLYKLPYASLAPVISDRTLSFHHGKHLQAYVDNLNKLIAGTAYEGMSLEEIVRKSSGAVFNNAGQILNHELYFGQFKTPDQVGGDASSSLPAPTGNLSAPTGNLLAQLLLQWGSVEAFQAEFEAKGVSLFGSGWVWLAAAGDGTLQILQCPGADNPVAHVVPGQSRPLRPILTFDVWEHAYYLDYQNRRAAHLHALWQIVDWKVVEERYDNKKN